ncbi:MAG: T9SS type A sorting domain-containing protein [Bacteroidota bacterium]
MKPYLLLTLLLCYANSSLSQWEDRKSNLPIPWGVGAAIDACDMSTAVVALAKGIWLTHDAGLSWLSLEYSNANGFPMDVTMPNNRHLWVASDAGRILHWNAGSGIWQMQYEDTAVTPFMNFIQMFDTLNGIAMGDAKADGLPAVFLRTSDCGVHWTSVNDSAFGFASGDTWRRLDFSSRSVGYFYESGANPQKLYTTQEGGSHWMALPFPDTIHVQNLNFYDDHIGLVKGFWWENPSVNGQVIARTLNGGSSWEVFSDTAMHWGNDFEFVPGDAAKVWFTDNNNLFFSVDTGRSWTQRWPRGGRDIVFTDPAHGWVLGDDTLLIYTSNGGVTALREADAPFAGIFMLDQNYPNPFNPSTTICYGLPHRSHVTLTVFNTLGQRIAELVNEEVEAGYHRFTFDASGLSSGVYFYQLIAEGFAQTKRLVLLR